MTEKLQKISLLLLPFSLILIALFFPQTARIGVARGTEIVVRAALPALFPALVISRMLCRTAGVIYGKKRLILPYLLGLLCGFPIGAMLTVQWYRMGYFSRRDAAGLLFCCNNVGAAFLFGFCGSVFGSSVWPMRLFLLQGGITLCFFLAVWFRSKGVPEVPTADRHESFSGLLLSALREGSEAFLFLGACILFFSFLSAVAVDFFHLGKTGQEITSLLLELTGGIHSLSGLPLNRAIPLCAFGCGFGGFSVLMQTLGILEGSDLSPFPYVLGKLILGLLMTAGVFLWL